MAYKICAKKVRKKPALTVVIGQEASLAMVIHLESDLCIFSLYMYF